MINDDDDDDDDEDEDDDTLDLTFALFATAWRKYIDYAPFNPLKNLLYYNGAFTYSMRKEQLTVISCAPYRLFLNWGRVKRPTEWAHFDGAIACFPY